MQCNRPARKIRMGKEVEGQSPKTKICQSNSFVVCLLFGFVVCFFWEGCVCVGGFLMDYSAEMEKSAFNQTVI